VFVVRSTEEAVRERKPETEKEELWNGERNWYQQRETLRAIIEILNF
jgi:predicted RNA-binding protein with PUA-like domain